jgi:hypothetical protein
MQSHGTFDSPSGSRRELIDRLYRKALVNHLSKLPEMSNVALLRTLTQVADSNDLQLNSLLAQIAAAVTSEDVVREARALYLSMHNREKDVQHEFPDRIESFNESDRNQVADADDPRTLDHYLANGLTIEATAADKALARSICTDDQRAVPIIEKLKAARLLTINGFANSRVMYLIHDMIDHVWFFDHLRNVGLFTRYRNFLISIDINPATSFLYSRQSEVLSTICFGTRRWPLAKTRGERLLTREDDIAAIVEADNNPHAGHVMRVYEGMTPENRELTRAVVENMVVQIADERRRWGAIKQRRGNGRTQSVAGLLDPLHLSLLIEATDALQKCQTYRPVQLEALMLVEDLLEHELLQTAGGSQFRVNVPRSIGVAPRTGSLTMIEWFEQNLGFSTCYDPVP